MKNYWKQKNDALYASSAVGDVVKNAKKLGSSIGRPCCGSRDMMLHNGTEKRKSTFVDFREFKGWKCSVNWFFLHLEQQTDQVFHHQTCQAKFNGTRGAIGKISEGKKLVDDLRKQMQSGTMPTIVCPKQTCGCGLCAPKSMQTDKLLNVLDNHIDIGVLDDHNG
jgi:hypothetical protein